MRELDERRIYEEEDEIDLMELFHTILKHKVKIVIVTIVVMLLSTLGGYIYNRLNSFNTAIIGFNYPELQKGKNPDGSIFLRTDIIPLDVINDTYNMYQEKLGGKKLDDFRNSIEVEGIIPDSTQTLIDNALKRGETLSFTKILSITAGAEIYTGFISPGTTIPVYRFISERSPTSILATFTSVVPKMFIL